MSNDATKPGVSGSETDLEVVASEELDVEVVDQPVELTGRDAIFAKVDEGRRNELLEENVELSEVEDTDLPAEQMAVELKPEVDELGTEEVAAQPAEVDNGDGTFTIKVDGETLVKTKEEMVVLAQKGLSADSKFEAAANQSKTNKQVAENLNQREANLVSREAEPEVDADMDPGKIFETLKDAVLTDDDEVGAEAVKKFLSSKQKPAATEDIGQLVKDEVASGKRAEELATAQATFAGEFPEILKSTTLVNGLNVEAARIFEADPTKPQETILREAGEFIRKEIGFVPPAETSTDQEKINRKKQIASKTVASQQSSQTREQPAATVAVSSGPNRSGIAASIIADRQIG